MHEKLCRICRNALNDRAFNRICGSDVCDTCRLGNLVSIVTARGWKLKTSSQHLGSEVATGYRAWVEGSLDRPLTLEASFRIQMPRHSVLKLFKKEIEVGDRIFDDAVYVSTTDSDRVSAWLGVRSVRAAILEILLEDHGLLSNDVKVSPDGLEVRSTGVDSDLIQLTQLRCCVLLDALEAFREPEPRSSPYR